MQRVRVSHFACLMCVFFSRSRDMARVVAGCDTRGRVLKRKALQLSDAVKTRSWLWPSTKRLRAPPLPLSLCPTVTCAAAVMMTPSCRAPLALHQEAKLTLSNSHCTALPALTTSPLPHHHLQAPSRLLITALSHKARVRLIRGGTTPCSQGPSTHLPCLIPPCKG